MTLQNRLRRGLGGLAALAAVLVTALSLLGSSPVAAPAGAAVGDRGTVWQARVIPTRGTADDYVEIRTSGGCPRPATNIVGRIFGSGFPKEGANIIGNTDAGVSRTGPFIAASQASFKAVMFKQRVPRPFRGTYRLEVICRTAKRERSYGTYVVAIRFKDDYNWVAAKPVTTAQGYNPMVKGGKDAPAGVDAQTQGQTPGAEPSTPASGREGSTTPAPDAAASSGGPDASSAPAAGGTDPAAPSTTGAAAATTGTGGTVAAAPSDRRRWGWVLAGAGGLIALASLALLRRRSV